MQDFLIGVILCLGGFGLGAGVGHTIEHNSMEATAISVGVARYEVNPRTGETHFVYLRPCQH